MAFTDGCPDNCNNPQKLIYGFDSNGCMCGADCTSTLGIDNTGKYSLYIPDPREPTNRLCMATCPPGFAFNKTVSIQYNAYQCLDNVCSIQGETDLQFYLQRTKGALLSGDGYLDNCFLPGSNSSDCWYPTYPTAEVLYKCIPRIPTNLSADQVDTLGKLGLPVDAASFGSAMAFMTNPAGQIGVFTAELSLTWGLLLGSIGIAILLGFVWMILIRMLALVMLWVTVIALWLVFALCALFAWDKTGKIAVFDQVTRTTGQNITALAEQAGVPGADATASADTYEAFAWIFTVLFIVYTVLMFFFFKRIVIAVKIIKEAAKAMAAMPFLIIQPLFTLLSLIVLYGWAGIITVFLISAGEFDITTGTFTYAGGSCTDLVNQEFNLTTTASIFTISLASSVWMKRGFYSTDGGANWVASPAGGFALLSNFTRGENCSMDPLTGLDRCTVNSNTSSSPAFAIGGCLGDLGGACETDKLVAGYFTPPGSGDTGLVFWNATLGLVLFDVASNTTIQGGDLRFATTLRPCSDGAASCAPWDFAGLEFLPGLNATYASWGLETQDVTSFHNLSYSEVVRACNLYGAQERALQALVEQKKTELVKQGKVDMQELTTSLWVSKPTADNWKSFLPVTLDGNTYNYFVVYHLFMFLWTNNFTVSAAYFILAGAVANWYWTMDKKELSGPIRKSTWRFVRYHMGTVCVGSFIIAVVQLIRILFNYFVNRSKQFKDNPLVKALVCVVNCCLWCLEKVIGYINKNAYIMCATHGHYFCRAAFKGFSLLMRNIMRVAAINMVAGVLLTIGKLFICLATLALCYGISTVLAADLGLVDGPPFLSLVMITIIGWFIGSSFMGTFEAAVDTIFLSFLHDQEVNNGKDKPYFMADSLKSSLGVSNKVTPSA
eukprot:CAMPEP_0206259920 /NCGR_PEP_ID=MMETSP0047_2-20121206/26781_1 /ASSEMBLY_ACC=CAM_ASM_000192 /TAXON_ID=195065 /ORGANISM="Chroomonas mesostigmatica_cf, Strain CCMP1168" /LENGTH=890 /DNA_ID=CAMNT_0053686905 /DNA_START=131 /DNA_END=2803 /DNA_ORIENTATION=-